MRRIVVGLAFISIASSASAQQSTQPAQKDRKDFLIEAVESQRNDALSKLAICYADANSQIVALNAQIAQLQAQLKAATPTPPAQ